jgi:hypothetical protein
MISFMAVLCGKLVGMLLERELKPRILSVRSLPREARKPLLLQHHPTHKNS